MIACRHHCRHPRRGPAPLHAGGHRCANQKSGCGAAEGLSCDYHRGGREEGVLSPGGAGQRVLRRRLQVQAERTIRTINTAMLRRVAAGAGRRGQWHLMLPDILSQITEGSTLPRRWRQISPTLTPKWLILLCATSSAGPSARYTGLPPPGGVVRRNRGLEVQSRQRRLQRGHLPFDVLCASTSLLVLQLRPPLTDKLLHVGLGRGLGRAPMI